MTAVPRICTRCGEAPPSAPPLIGFRPGAQGGGISGISLVGGGIDLGEGASASVQGVGAGACSRCDLTFVAAWRSSKDGRWNVVMLILGFLSMALVVVYGFALKMPPDAPSAQGLRFLGCVR